MDHINYSYTFDKSKDIPFDIVFDPTTRNLESHDREITKTAKHISNSISGQVYVFSSGGIDSEIIAREFVSLKRDFKVITFNFQDSNNNNNLYDTNYAVKWCKHHNVEQIIHNVDIEDFVKHRIPNYISKEFYSFSIYRYMQIYMMEFAENLNGHAVLGGRENNFKLNDLNQICIPHGSWFNTGIDYCFKTNQQHYPAFFLQNPEIFASYLKLPVVNTMISDPGYFTNVPINASLEKMIEYRRLYPELELRRKFSGYESLQHIYNNVKSTMISQFKDECKTYLIPLNNIKEQLKI